MTASNTDLSAVSGQSLHKIEIIAHRGASREAHENTLDAFAIAVELGADRIETDVRRTWDNVLVLHHDPTIAGRMLCELEYADLLNISRQQGFTIPTLNNALSRFGDKIRWDIELKEAGYEDQVVEEIGRLLQPSEYVITSFNDSVVRTLRTRHPQITAGLILGDEAPQDWLRTRISELFPMRRLQSCDARVIVANHNFIRFGFLQNIRNHRGQLWLWTVNNTNHLRRYMRIRRVSGIVTDDVRLALQIREEMAS